jgi:hypothetical protein
MIKNSLEWANYRSNLVITIWKKVTNIQNARQLRNMIDNLEDSVTELSKAEIQIRHGDSRTASELLIKINEEIELVEEFILVAVLIG